jgi:hypothetical protein
MSFAKCSLIDDPGFEVNLDARAMLALLLEIAIIYFLRIEIKKPRILGCPIFESIERLTKV